MFSYEWPALFKAIGITGDVFYQIVVTNVIEFIKDKLGLNVPKLISLFMDKFNVNLISNMVLHPVWRELTDYVYKIHNKEPRVYNVAQCDTNIDKYTEVCKCHTKLCSHA